MKKLIFISLILSLVTGAVFFSCKQKITPPTKEIEQTLVKQIDSFARVCRELQTAVEKGADPKQIQELFLQSRLGYKKIEWAVEYFVPAISNMVNGPPVQEVELSGRVIEPDGLQVIEGILFPAYDGSKKEVLFAQLKKLQTDCSIFKSFFTNIDILDGQVFDAGKLEVFRIITLGIAGFDDPLTLKSMTESAAALKSLQIVFAHYPDEGNAENLNGKLDAATKYLSDNSDFNSFNRMDFINAYSNPVTISMSNLELKLKIPVIRYNRLLNQDAKTLFDSNSFNVNAYAPDQLSFLSGEKIALGEKLFADPMLSGTGTRSCQSCHQPGKAFTDGQVKNTVLGDKKLLQRNTPTLINAALQPSLFYDLRVSSLEDQSHTVVQSNLEMHGSLKLSVKRLWEDKKYREMFSKAFPQKDRTEIDTLEVMNAIGSFVRSLIFLNSRFDEYMRGNKAEMNEDEVNGFNLFMGKAKCATCHYLPLFNGTFPPRFIKIESEVIGVPQSISDNKLDSDLGRFNIIPIESFRHAFKTSTVRNTAQTAPYMHNGVFTTLEQVMDFYNKGGGAGLGFKMNNQTLPFEKLNLSEKEVKNIIAFMKSLDSKLPEEKTTLATK